MLLALIPLELFIVNALENSHIHHIRWHKIRQQKHVFVIVECWHLQSTILDVT